MASIRALGAGVAALGLGIGALIPIFLVAYPAAGVTPADAGRPEVILPVIAATPLLIEGPGFLEVATHLLGGAALLGLWMTLGKDSILLTTATVAGIAWMAVDVIANAVTLHVVPILAVDHMSGSPTAATSLALLTQVVDGLRLGAHALGGLWIVGFSEFARRTGLVPAAISWIGIPVGVVLSANLLAPALMNVSFMTVPAWLVALGIALTRTKPASELARRSRLAMA